MLCGVVGCAQVVVSSEYVMRVLHNNIMYRNDNRFVQEYTPRVIIGFLLRTQPVCCNGEIKSLNLDVRTLNETDDTAIIYK